MDMMTLNPYSCFLLHRFHLLFHPVKNSSTFPNMNWSHGARNPVCRFVLTSCVFGTKPNSHKMEDKRTKEVLDFLLSAYRARLAIQDTSDGCPFDFGTYMKAWANVKPNWDTLKGTMEGNLELVLKEGLLDSILPYLTPSFEVQLLMTSGQDTYSTWFSHSTTTTNMLGSISDLNLITSHNKTRERRKSREIPKDSDDPDIIIHVCDESKGVREDFLCKQSILTQEMGYFTRVTVKGQRLRDMDISVHCDIAVFDWLIKWVQHRTQQIPNPPKLEPTNVVGLVVSADFLQMSTLVQQCLQFMYDNLESVIATSPNLGCLSDPLASQLAGFFSNVELERRIFPVDKNDRILTRLYQQFIIKLNDSDADMSRGHYASTRTMFKCELCEQYLTNDFAPKLPCFSMRFDCRGRIYACHVKDRNWSLPLHIKELKKELRSWRKVYWRLWGAIHFFFCSNCQLYFAAKNLGTCRYHKEDWLRRDAVKAVGLEETTSFLPRTSEEPHRFLGKSTANKLEEVDFAPHQLPYGNYPCCNLPAGFYSPLPRLSGCQLRDHVVDNFSDEDPNITTTFALRDIIEDSTTPWKPRLDWNGLIQVTTEKPSTSGSTASTVFLPKGTSTILCRLSQEMTQNDDITTAAAAAAAASHDSDSDSSSEYDGAGCKVTCPSAEGQGKVWESWLWNNDLTTRYNQDMQREREEKLMMDLACLLSQRVPLDSSVGFHATKYGFLSRRIAKENIGGTYVKIDQSWREQHQLAMTKGHKNKMHKSSRPE